MTVWLRLSARHCFPPSCFEAFLLIAVSLMVDIPQTDVSRPAALPTAKLLQRSAVPSIDQNSSEYLDSIEEEWNKKVDVEIDTLVDGMVDLVGLASVCATSCIATMEAALILLCRSARRTSSRLHRRHTRQNVALNLW